MNWQRSNRTDWFEDLQTSLVIFMYIYINIIRFFISSWSSDTFLDGHSIDCLHQTHPTVTTGGQMLLKDPPPLPIGFRKLIFPAHHGPYKLFRGSTSITWGASRSQIMSGGGEDRWLPSAADWHSDTYSVGLKWEVVVSTSVCHFESGTVARAGGAHTHPSTHQAL